MATAIKFQTKVELFESQAEMQERLIKEKRWAELDWEWVDRNYAPEAANELYKRAMKDDKLKF